MVNEKRIGIPYEEYCERINRLQAIMEEQDLDAVLCYGSEGVYRNIYYLAGYWPAFEEGGVLVGRKGLPLLLNGSESFEYAATAAFGPGRVRACAEFEHADPIILSCLDVKFYSFKDLFDEITGGKGVKRLGLGDYNIFPHSLYMELEKACGPKTKIVNCEKVMSELRMNKTPLEIDLVRQACIITEKAFDTALGMVNPEMTQYEMQGVFTAELFKNGGEGPGFAMCSFSGPMTRCSIGRNKHIVAGRNQIINVGFGCHYCGYCGSFGRPFMFGKIPDSMKREMDFIIDIHQKVIYDWVKPGVTSEEVHAKYTKYFVKNGYGNPPGSPCHGLGIMEDEDPVFRFHTPSVLKPGMTCAADNYFRNDKYGFRFEDVIVVTEGGAEPFTKSHWEHIEL